MKILIYALIAVLSISCKNELKINAKDEKSAKASIEKIKETLNIEDKKKFEEAIQILVFSDLNMMDIMSGNTKDFVSDSFKKIDGQSAKEVISKANVIITARKQKEKEQALIEINELKNKKLLHQKELEQAKSIEVVKSRYYIRRSTYSKDPIIELKIKNNSKQSLSRLYLEGTLASPGRKVPWLVKEFNYEIPGGAEPGETLELNLAPNQYMGWTTNVKKDALFTVKVKGADDHNKKSLFGKNDFKQEDQDRLNTLINKYQRDVASE